MARVEIYNGHSSVVPVLFATYDSRWNTSGLDMVKIKEEPLDSDVNDDGHLQYNASNGDETTTRDSRTINHVDTKMTKPNIIMTSNKNDTTEGSSSTCSNINKNHVDDSKIISNGSSIRRTTRITNQSHIENENNVIDRRLRTRTKSNLVECDICYATFPEGTDLRSHKNYYARGELICHLCKIHFVIPIHLTSHRRSAHRGDDWSRFKYECNYCKLGFVKKHYLQQHIFHHHNINKILNNKSIRRRLKSRNIALEKIRVNSKSCDHQQNKRKRDDKVIVGPLRKKVAMAKKHGKIDVPYQVKNNENNQFNNDDQTNEIILPQKSISNNQNNNNKNNNGNALWKSSVQPPLVKICAVPNEVEALLNDCESSDENFSIDSDASSSSDSELSDTTCYIPMKKYSLRSTTSRFSSSQTSNRSTKRKWAILRKRFNCRDCQVQLERLSIPLSIDYELTKDISDIGNTKEDETIQINSRPTVGMELKNLELALKKLQDVNQGQDKTPIEEKQSLPEDIQSSNESTNVVSLPSEDIPITNSSTSRMLYISSLCQTRYTTKKKLVYHYLCFHTNPQYQECAVCRSRCANLTELTEHLMQHCIEIPESLQEESPIDPKESCENSKEKYMCKRCKKKFWLVSSLKDHEQRCEMICEERVKNSPNNQQSDDATISDEQSDSILRTRLNQRNIDDDHHDDYDDDDDAQSTQKPDDQISISLECTVCHTKFQNVTKYLEHNRKYSLGIGKYYCSRCGVPFPSPSLLGAHTRTAHEFNKSSPDNTCVICDQGFREKCFLRQHMLHIHNDELKVDPVIGAPRSKWNHEHTCHICNLIFPDRIRYVEHLMYYYDDDIIECSICHETFSGKYKALTHKKKVHDTEETQREHIYSCNICNEGFIRSSDLYSHMRHVHNTNIEPVTNISMNENKQETNRHGILHMCRVCDEVFGTAALLTDHQLEYSNTGNHTCLHCSRKCQTRTLLEKHIKLTHSGPPRGDQVKCHSCDEISESKVSWHSHLKHFHILPITNLRLSRICTSGTYSMERGVEQITVVNETENSSDPRTSHPIGIEYTCALCDMQFMNSMDLKTHSLNFGNTCIHSNPEIVNTNFSIASIYSVNLEDYEKLCNAKDDGINSIRMDGQNKISEIKDDDTEFGTVDDTKTMSVIRSFDMLNAKYRCEICLTNFPSRSSLTKHRTKYSNTGDYKCEICHRKFRNIVQHQIHIKKHENRKRDIQVPSHYCKTCDEKFASENSKRYHFAHMHGVLLKSLAFDNNERRQSTRQQSKLMHQTNLDTFITRNPNDEKNLNETTGLIEMHSNDEITSNSDLNTDAIMNSSAMIESEPPQTTLTDIQIRRSGTIEHTPKTTNPSPEVVPDNLTNETGEKILERVEIQKEFMEVPQKLIEGQNQIEDSDIIEVERVVAGQEIEIVLEEEEIIEVEDVGTNVKTTRGLCDICGNAFINRKELIDHQKNSHNIELIIDTFSDTQEEYIDIELISDDEVQYDEPSRNNDETDIDIIFDGTSVCHKSNTSTSTPPLKPQKTYSRKNQLMCRICGSLFYNLSSLGEHLEKLHQTDSPTKEDNIQNPRVSSSSKTCNTTGRTDFRHVQLCCKFCGKQFSEDQYLYAHIQKRHANQIAVNVAPRKKLGVPPDKTDDIQNNSPNDEYINAKQSKVAVVKTTDAMKKIVDNVVLNIKPQSELDTSHNSMSRNSRRYARLIPIAKLIRTLNKGHLLPKPNQLHHNDMSR